MNERPFKVFDELARMWMEPLPAWLHVITSDESDEYERERERYDRGGHECLRSHRILTDERAPRRGMP